jgi:predicted RNase H-like nuclease (RuvC/YqgF family)
LPPGSVEVTVPPAASAREDTWAVLQRIWAEQKAEGRQPRTVEEIDAGINELRDDLEEHAPGIERLQEETEAQRKKGDSVAVFQPE